MNNLDKDLIYSIPVFEQGNILYLREEKDDCLTFMPKSHPEIQYLEMDSVARHIINLCDGTNTVDDIVNNILRNYSGTSRQVVMNDVVNLMHNFWRLDLIKWRNYNPLGKLYSDKNEEYRFSLLTEEEVASRIFPAITSLSYINPCFMDNVSYGELAIRQKAFSFTESFFVLSKKDDQILLISMVPLLYKAKCLRVGIMNIYGHGPDPALFNKFLKWATVKYQDFLQKIVKTQFTRIDIYINEETIDQQVLAFVKNTGFKYSGSLKKELGETTDLKVYSYKLLTGNH